MREHKITVVVVLAVIVLLALYLFVYQVRVTEVAVHYRPPGKVLKVLNAGASDESGLYFRLPWPIDKLVKYDRRVRVLDGPLPQTQLRDEWQVIISMYCAWRLADPVAFEKSLRGNEREAERRLKDVILNETSKAVAKLTFRDFASTNEQDLKFDDLEQEITREVRRAVHDKGYGMEVVAFGVRRIAIPASTTNKVFERMQAEREAVAEKYRAEGKMEKQAIIAEAQKTAKNILSDAESEAKRIRSEGEAEEAKYYGKFAEHPELAIFLRRLEALRTIAQKAREAGTPITFVLDTRTEPLAVLYRGPQEEGLPSAAVASSNPAPQPAQEKD